MVGSNPNHSVSIWTPSGSSRKCFKCCLMVCLFVCFPFLSMSQKTFEAKIHHLETRLSRKPREGTAELEYFVRCEVHSSDLNTFISSIKRVAEDVRTTKEDKCKELTDIFTCVERLSSPCRYRAETLLFPVKGKGCCVLILSKPEGIASGIPESWN